MENNFKTFIKHALKTTTDYIAVLFIFVIFSYPIISISGENPKTPVFWTSIILFIIAFYLVYKDMQEIAIREKRPQYEINPTPVRGMFMGLAALVPIWFVQIVIVSIPLPDFLVLQHRALQAVSVPVYWLASLLGGSKLMYFIVLLILAGIAALGYYSGLQEFYILKKFYKFIGYTPKVKVRKKARKKTGRSFWGM